MHILTFTTLYPNAEQIRHGIFVEQRMRHFRDHSGDRITVVAPVPWFPFKSRRFGAYGAYARVPRREERHGIEIFHPRYPVIPKLGMSLAPWLMTAFMLPWLWRLRRRTEYRFDLIDAHFFYPDGVAAVVIGKALRVPVVVTVRGNDVSLYPRWFWPRCFLRWAIPRTDAIVCVSQALKDAVLELARPSHPIEVLRNGVDLTLFRPVDGEALRAELGISGPMLICVGHLIERKGQHLVVEALRDIPEATLVLVGDGPMEGALRSQVAAAGLEDRVVFCGGIEQGELSRYYSAADAMILASSREGWANVLLESMACGTPVVATEIWGTPEVVRPESGGVLVKDREPGAIAEAVRRLLDSSPSREEVRRYAEQFDWKDPSIGLEALFSRLVSTRDAG